MRTSDYFTAKLGFTALLCMALLAFSFLRGVDLHTSNLDSTTTSTEAAGTSLHPDSLTARLTTVEPVCRGPKSPARTLTLAAEYGGPLAFGIYRGVEGSFMGTMLKWSDVEIALARQRALGFFQRRFGVTPGMHGEALEFQVLNTTFVKTSDSDGATGCGGTTARVAFSVVNGVDATYGGSFGGPAGVKVFGRSSVFVAYVVTAADGYASSVIEWFGTLPYACSPLGTCVVVGNIRALSGCVATGGEDGVGNLDGLILQQWQGQWFRGSYRFTLTWPRQLPLDGRLD